MRCEEFDAEDAKWLFVLAQSSPKVRREALAEVDTGIYIDETIIDENKAYGGVK